VKLRRTPFYGDAGDREILAPGFKLIAVDEMTDIPPAALDLIDVVTLPAGAENGSGKPGAPTRTVSHEDYREKGTSVALGYLPHQGENRRQRRAAVATWVPPKDQPKAETAGEGSGDQDVGPEPSPVPTPRMPTRRELWLQRKKHRRGQLDPELRRLQKAKLNGPRSD